MKCYKITLKEATTVFSHVISNSSFTSHQSSSNIILLFKSYLWLKQARALFIHVG
jgi:hypothetical protein